jgi:hypothetical protein
MATKKHSAPTLPRLIGRTRNLRSHLERLVKNFPETDIDLGKQIWIRLFNTVWRYPADMCGPYPQKQTEAIEWLKSYEEYKSDLKYYFLDVVRDPSAFENLPVTREVYIRSATEVLTVLRHQETHLRGILQVAQIRTDEPSRSEAPHGSEPNIAISADNLRDSGSAGTSNRGSEQEAQASPKVGAPQFGRERLDGVDDEPRIATAAARKAVVMPILASKKWAPNKWATQAGVGKNSVYEYLNGKRKLTTPNRRALAEELGLKPEGLPD